MTTTAFIKKEWPTLLVLIAPFVALPFVWAQAPDQIPIHWNAQGEPDNVAGKTVGLLLLPLINVAVYAFYWIAPVIDPKRRIGGRQKPIPKLRFFTALFLTAMYFVTLAQALDVAWLTVGRLIPLVALLLLMVVGNYLVSIQPNYFIGIRTPWALEDPDNWRKTHRLGGRLWVATACLLLVLWLLLPSGVFLYAMLGGLVTMVVAPIVYSYSLYAAGQPASDAQARG